MPEHASLAASPRLHKLEEWISRQPPELHATHWHNFAEVYENNPTESGYQDLAITCYERAASLTTDVEQKANFSSHHSLALLSRAEATGVSMEADLQVALGAAKVAVDLTPPDDLDLSVYLANYGDIKIRLAQVSPSATGQDEGIKLLKKAIALHPKEVDDGYADAVLVWHAKLRQELYNRAIASGRVSHLEEALEEFEINAMEWLDDTDRYWFADLLRKRYALTMSTLDLDKAIELLELLQLPELEVNRAARLVLLGICLRIRAQQTNLEDDCNASFARFQDALEQFESMPANVTYDLAIPAGSAASPAHYRCIILANMASSLSLRYHVRGLDDAPYDPSAPDDDLDEAIRLFREALKEDPNDRIKGNLLTTLGAALFSRYRKKTAPKDLDDSITALQMALKLESSEFHAQTLTALGAALEYKATDLDWEQVVEKYERAVEFTESPVKYRLMAADDGGRFLWKHDRARSNRLFERAVQLLPALNSRSLMLADQQKNLLFFEGQVWSAVSSSLETKRNAYKAIQLAEAGRGIIASLQLDIHSDISKLQDQHELLAKRFGMARDSLSEIRPSWEEDPNSRFDKAAELRAHNKGFEAVLDEIRGLDGFEDFLGCPTESTLMTLTVDGPIVIFSISEYRSDALLITSSGLRYVELPKLKQKDVLDRSKEFLEAIVTPKRSEYENSRNKMKNLLEWLWDVAVSDVLVELGFTETPQKHDEWPKIWWVRAGIFSLFPLHAAGYHESQPRDSVLDRVVSCYTTTIKSLIFARRARNANTTSDPNVLVVGMPETPGQKKLRMVEAELDELQGIFPAGPSVHFKTNPDYDAIFPLLQESDIFHFSGHGISSSKDASRSCLLLQDWQTRPLTVASLRSARIDRGEFTYLSACHSASSAGIALHLLDESLHISSAFQLAGFRRTVATLWYAYGDHAVDVARDLYAQMRDSSGRFEYSRAALALHLAVRNLRDRLRQTPGVKMLEPDDPLAWAAYIYTGA